MLGYCKPDKEELKVRTNKIYLSYYCTLCHTLQREFGILTRFFLSNDLVFLFICLDALTEDGEMLTGRCPGNPLKKTEMMASARAARYAAFLNYYLVLKKIEDHMADSVNPFNKAFWRFLNWLMKRKRRFRKCAEQYVWLTDLLDDSFRKLNELEMAQGSFDDITNTFGHILEIFADGFKGNIDNANEDSFKTILFNMGKWLYLADALDDYSKDEKQHSFNLLNTIASSQTDEQERILEYVRKSLLLLYLMQMKMITACRSVQWNDEKGYVIEIIENILVKGTANTMRQIVRKRYPSYIDALNTESRQDISGQRVDQRIMAESE